MADGRRNMSNDVRGYHLTEEQLTEICERGGLDLHPNTRDSTIFDCHCDMFLHNESSTGIHLDGAYDLARYAARHPRIISLPDFTQLFCKRSQQVAFLSCKFWPEEPPKRQPGEDFVFSGLHEHINTWELIRILFCDFFGDFAPAGQPESPRPSYLPADEMCRETTESLLRLPGETPKLQLLCRCLHWLEHTARRSDLHDDIYLDSITNFDKQCASSALFDPDSKPKEYKKMRVDLSEPVYHAIRRGDARFAAEILLKNKEYWFSSFVRVCAPTFFNLPYDASQTSPQPPCFLPNEPIVHANQSDRFIAQRRMFQEHSKRDNSELELPRHDILDCGSSAPQLLHGLQLMRGLNSDLIDDKSSMRKVLSALSDSDCFSRSDADMQLPAQDFLWKKLRAAWVRVIESKLEGKQPADTLLHDLSIFCKSKLHSSSDDATFFWQDVQIHLVCAALSRSPEGHLVELTDLLVRFVQRHEKAQDTEKFSQALAFCTHFCTFLNAALRIRNDVHKPAICSGMSKKFTGLHAPNLVKTPSFSLPKLVFNGQIFGGCMHDGKLMGNFYASYFTENDPEKKDPKLWQKIGLMIACCCGEEPEEKCMQQFCSSVINHPDIINLRKWQSEWVGMKRDSFDSLKLSNALTEAAKLAGRRDLRDSDQGEKTTTFESLARDLFTQIGLESNERARQELMAQLATITLNWSKNQLETAKKQLKGEASASRLLECLKLDPSSIVLPNIFHPFLEDEIRWSFLDISGISLSDVAELYGLFKATEVTEKIQSVMGFYDGLDVSCAAIPNLLARLDELKHAFQQLFWPPLSDNDVNGPFHLMQKGIWNEWQLHAPIRSLNVIPLLVHDVVACCRALRQKALHLLYTSPPSAETVESKKLIAVLYRRVHDTVQSITIDLADRSAVRRSNVEFYLNRMQGLSPLEVLFRDGDAEHNDTLRQLMAFAAEDRFGPRDGDRPEDWL